MNIKKVLHIVAFVLLIIGGIDWGVIGFFGGIGASHADLLELVFGNSDFGSTAIQLVQTLVGLSAVYLLFTHKGDCKTCGGK